MGRLHPDDDEFKILNGTRIALINKKYTVGLIEREEVYLEHLQKVITDVVNEAYGKQEWVVLKEMERRLEEVQCQRVDEIRERYGLDDGKDK